MRDNRIELTRRKIIASVGAVGAAGAGTGLGTSAFFSDQEDFANNQLVAGELDLKVAVSQHYVDWLPDTDTTNGNRVPDRPQETDDAGMPGTVDLALGAGDVGGTDTVARDIELDITDATGLATGSLVNTINGGVPVDGLENLCDSDEFGGDDDVDRAIVRLEDVKPGDFGFVRFAAASCDNPAFAWVRADIESAAENSLTEPERDDDDERADPDPDVDGEYVELLDVVQTAVIGEDVADRLSADPGDPPLEVSPEQTLRGLVDTDEPVPGDLPANQGGGAEGARNCFSGDRNFTSTLVWWVPIDHGNEIQTDSVTFSLGLYVEQCRHNDGDRGTGPLVIEDQTADPP